MVLMPSKLLLLVGVSLTAASDHCTDIPPDAKATCAQRLAWGGCNKTFMKGHCCRTCWQCHDAQGLHGCGKKPTPSPTPPVASPRRLVVNGRSVTSSGAPHKPIQLRGFTFWFQDKPNMRKVQAVDRNVTTLFPGVNVARLVMDHWHDRPKAEVGPGSGDCSSEDSSIGYMTRPCLQMFDEAIAWATGEAKMWVIITARASQAAGDAGKGHTVFTNNTLRLQMIAMWSFLAKRYKGVDGIGGFEVMSEPRTLNDHDVVHKFHVDACHAVWQQDSRAVCFVGPAKFYDRTHLGPEWIVSGGPVIYAANFFVPSLWITGKDKSISYGGSARCCDIAQSKSCPSGCNEVITLKKAWLSKQLETIDEFQRNYSVPMWIDQWGAHTDVGGGASSQRQYLKDVLALFEDRNLHWSYWWYKDSFGEPHCIGNYAITCVRKDGTLSLNQVAITELGKYMGSTELTKYADKSVLV